MGQAILKVDFVNKKLIPNPQNNSGCYKNKHTLYNSHILLNLREFDFYFDSKQQLFPFRKPAHEYYNQPVAAGVSHLN